MSRLIDADVLIERKFILHDMEELTHEEFEKLVNEQPTAYDTEAVVAELKKELNKGNDKCKEVALTEGHTLEYEFYSGKTEAYIKAIEIVRNGGAK